MIGDTIHSSFADLIF